MDAREAIAAAKNYVREIYADEAISHLELEEVEHLPGLGNWVITLVLYRPWKAPRTRAQEVLESLGAAPSSRLSYKIVTMEDGGAVLSMKDRPRVDAAE